VLSAITTIIIIKLYCLSLQLFAKFTSNAIKYTFVIARILQIFHSQIINHFTHRYTMYTHRYTTSDECFILRFKPLHFITDLPYLAYYHEQKYAYKILQIIFKT